MDLGRLFQNKKEKRTSVDNKMASSTTGRGEPGEPQEKSKGSRSSRRRLEETIQALKHFDTFYGQAPPGLVQEKKDNPEDCIPDLPENKGARQFLAKAPTKGLWMPLGKEVKVMKCWRCKAYGHRTGDKECPMFLSGNSTSEDFRFVHEDPMHEYLKESKTAKKKERIQQLQALLDEPTDSESSDSDSSGSSKNSEKNSRKRHRKHSKHKRKKQKSHHHKSKKRKKEK